MFTALWKDEALPITADRERQRIPGGGLGGRLDYYSEARIPVGRTNRLREPGAWDRYRYYIVGAILVLLVKAALIAGLLIQLGRRRHAEASVLESEAAELRASHARYGILSGG